jgi:DNA invertase Pin-like site-specific DNA recombinase
MAKKKVSKAKLLEAIKAAGGKWTGICEILDINRSTLSRYIQDDTEIAEACEFARDRIVERAEHKLAEAIERGESWAIQLALKDSKRGKERGYGNSVDVTSGGEKIKVVVEYVDNQTAETARGTNED